MNYYQFYYPITLGSLNYGQLLVEYFVAKDEPRIVTVDYINQYNSENKTSVLPLLYLYAHELMNNLKDAAKNNWEYRKGFVEIDLEESDYTLQNQDK